MKGLLVKDFCILKLQKNTLLILLAMCVVFTVSMKSPTYIVSLLPMYGGLVSLGTLSYDEFDRGYSFLFTLPISKKGYVREKYVFGLLLCGGTWLVSVLLSSLYVLFVERTEMDASLLVAYAVPIVLVVFLIGIAIPVQLKYGNERGRLAVVATGLVIFAVIIAGGQLMKFLNLEVEPVLETISQMKMSVLVLLVVAGVVLFLGISYWISVRVMEKKEF